MSDPESQLPEALRKALKDPTAFKPPEAFYQNVLRTVRQKEAPRSAWAWLWGTPMKLAAAMSVVMISYFAVRDQVPGGPKKVADAYEPMNSVRRSLTMVEKPEAGTTEAKSAPVARKKQFKEESSLQKKAAKGSLVSMNDKDMPALKNKVGNSAASDLSIDGMEKSLAPSAPAFRQRSSPIVFPGQGRAQAQQVAAISTLSSGAEPNRTEMDEAKPTPFLWEGRSSGITTFQTVVVTRESQWEALWLRHARDRAPQVDFNTSLVVGVFAGTRADLAGLTIVQTLSFPDHVQVIYREIPTSTDHAGADDSPFALRVIPKTPLPIRFEKQP